MDPPQLSKKRNNISSKIAKSPSSSHGSFESATRIRHQAKKKKDIKKESLLRRKEPRQSRSKEMVEAILQAAAEVFATRGYARATTNKIAARAGVSVGSLYQYYPNKDSLLASLLAEHHREVHRVVDTALTRLIDPATPLDDGLRHLFNELVRLHQANPNLTKALSAAVLRDSSAGDAIHNKKTEEAARNYDVSTLLANRPDVRDGDYAAMAAVLGQAIAQLSRWLVHDSPPGVDQSALSKEVVRMLVRYLER
ncbi:MAG: TetR/AcrR family transcriptional regulator [Proteobacteria bacterium]|nr:TetR/AcrR family transcriptional regulator [Pseudomonadota bacterium]